MAWLLWIGALVVLILLHKRWRSWNKWWSVAIATALFSSAFASTSLGATAAGLLRGLLGIPARWIGTSPAPLAALGVLVGIGVVVYGLWKDRSADKPEITAMILLPLLFIIASGPVAAHGGNLTDAINQFGQQGLAYLVQG